MLSSKTVHKYIKIQGLGPSGFYTQGTKITESLISSGGPQEGFYQFQSGETALARGRTYWKCNGNLAHSKEFKENFSVWLNEMDQLNCTTWLLDFTPVLFS